MENYLYRAVLSVLLVVSITTHACMVLSLVLFAPWLTKFTPLTNQKIHLPLFYPTKPHHTPNVSFYTLVYYIPGVYVHPISNSVV